MYQYLFGPVPSRRLGISLGIDLVPLKTCTLNFIYCECEQTTDLTLKRKEYVPLDAVKTEINHYLTHNPRPDCLTFSGSGEPVLHSRIGELLKYLKNKVPETPLALLTNGSLLYQKPARTEIMETSIVMPSLDAATGKIFTKVNRPHPQLRIDYIINGLIQFRKEYRGFFYKINHQ
jgi:wyosine [tRNA(Phe)-imidazoG37] synthetase (radical SAM superfamily)